MLGGIKYKYLIFLCIDLCIKQEVFYLFFEQNLKDKNDVWYVCRIYINTKDYALDVLQPINSPIIYRCWIFYYSLAFIKQVLRYNMCHLCKLILK